MIDDWLCYFGLLSIRDFDSDSRQVLQQKSFRLTDHRIYSDDYFQSVGVVEEEKEGLQTTAPNFFEFYTEVFN